MDEPAARLQVRTVATAFVGLLAVFWSQYIWIAPTNFGGFDEWPCLNLTTQGVLDIPNGNRPLGWLWAHPALWIAGHSFTGHWWVHGIYLSLTGAAVLWIGLRTAPGDVWAAFLAGTLAAVWAPSDLARLSTVQMTINSGSTCAAFLAVALLVESTVRRSRLALALAAACATVAALSYEACLGVIVAAPLLLALLPRRPGLWGWIGTWEAVALALSLRAAAPLLAGSGGAYQVEMIGLDPAPARVATRLVAQFGHHLAPLSGARTVFGPQAAFSGAVFAIACLGLALVHRRRSSPPATSPGHRLRLAGIGLVLAAAGYAPFVLGRLVQGANRTEFLAAGGIGLALGFGLQAAVSGVRPAWRAPLLGLAGTWVVFVGTAQVALMQRAWRGLSFYPPQVDTLRQLHELAPEVRSGTLLLLIDEAPRPAWPASFAFRHAVAYLYESRAVGHVLGAPAVFHSIRFADQGIDIGSDPVIEGPWRSPPTHHGLEQTVVLARQRDGSLRILEKWPEALPSPTDVAEYRPRERFVPGPDRPQWRALETHQAGGPWHWLRRPDHVR
jgi:hypothetical protein